MRRINRRSFMAAFGGAAAAGTAMPRPAISQSTFPSRPLRLMVPAPAGSRHGLSARLFAASLAKAIGKDVEVDNPDSSSGLAYSLIAGASPDGYTLGYATVDLAILHWRGLSNLKPGDFTPLALLNEDPAGIHVRADSPWQTARQLVDHIKANPGKVRASSTPAGGIWHLSTVSWLAALGLGIDALPWVPAAGPAAGVEDMMLGGAEVIVCSTPEVRVTPQAKSIRTLAIMARSRIPRFGDVPTVEQATGKLHVAGAWRGLVAPKGLDPNAAATLVAAAKVASDDPDFQAVMRRRGFVPSWSASPDFAQFLDAADTSMGATLKTAGLAKA